MGGEGVHILHQLVQRLHVVPSPAGVGAALAVAQAVKRVHRDAAAGQLVKDWGGA